MNLNAPGKLIVLTVIAVGCLAFIIAAMWTHADTTAAWSTLASIMGYLIGNGAGARKGQAQEPVWKPNEEQPQP